MTVLDRALSLLLAPEAPFRYVAAVAARPQTESETAVRGDLELVGDAEAGSDVGEVG